MENLIKKFLQKRWTIGGILILLFTALEIHGSSISIYADILGHPELSDIILGKYRAIRSDEWIAFTPFAFSQYFTNFSLISDVVRAAPTNMFMTYGQAVWHPAIIFRPAQIGYLFLDQGSGLAFFWMSRLVILFLISFEFSRLILKTEIKLSVIYAIMIAFSPLAQWWWSINSIAEILAAGQGVVVCWKLYLEHEEIRERFFYLAGFLYCAGVFIFGIYPAWQVPFGYVFLFCLISVSVTQKNALKNLWRDKFFWILGFAMMIAPIIHAVYISKDMIELQMATEYPGKRFTLGGTWSLETLLTMLFVYGTDVISPFKPIMDLTTNECEAASFFTMAPLGWLIFFYVRFKLKQKDILMTLAFVLSILFILWEIFTIPEWLAKISFMGMATDNRVRSAIDFLQMLMIFRGLSLADKFPSPFMRLILAELIAVLSVIAIYNLLPDWFGIKKAFSVFIFTTLSVFLLLSPMNKKIFATLIVLMLGIGATINPINKGVDVIYKMPVGQKISEIVQNEVAEGKEKSLWLVVNEDIAINDFPIMFGAPTINSLNVYPYFERWKKFDGDGKDFKNYNRYAHIIVNLQNEPTNFHVPRADFLNLNLNISDLLKLNARYIFSRKELENFSTPQIKFQKIYEDAGSFIYEINYE